MALNPLIDSRDVRFVLFEALEADKLSKYEKYAGFDKDTYEATLELAEQLAVEQVYPANAEADKTGAKYDPQKKTVTVPEGYKTAMNLYIESGFPGLGNDPQWGGTGMPEVICRAVGDYFSAAGVAFIVYDTLRGGASRLIENFGTDELKKIYLEKMSTGQWGGTMCLTEPSAGSDVGALKTKAVKQKDGTYLLTGQKIFITAGDNDLYENIIHPVLARIEGDPPGTPGISIFIVPKYHVNPDGSLGERNDIVTSGIEHKMGIKGSATCSLSLGDNGKCVGWLLGEERQGMKIMFQMMNEARLDVADQALGAASSAYMHAVTYAKSRIQGSDPAKKGDLASVMIVKHPDVKRMLLWMKSQVEAMRMLTLLAAISGDLSHVEQGEKAKEAKGLLDFLIPLCKAGNSDLAWLVTSEAMQVYGGYGFCSEYPVEQLARDSKILAIYEGTNGIQSIDLTMRKLLMNPEMFNYTVFKKRITQTLEKAKGVVDEKYIAAVRDGVTKMDSTVKKLAELRDQKKMLDILAVATPLQNAMRMLAHAWMHLWSLTITVPKLKEIAGDISGEKALSKAKDNAEAAYYYGRILSARYYLGSEFKHFEGYLNYITSGEQAVIEAFDEIFTGALPQ
ncbi:MAG TPA: acyl-CoA dehydrogenase [Deltaproteobacteria bacterium]|nr:acyl-CoA dehydrogenase [Deltaproteobacteria bacterium]